MRYRHSVDGNKRRRVFTAYVVIDMAGNPIRNFDTREEAERFVAEESHGNRIQEVNLNGNTAIIQNEVHNAQEGWH